MSRRTGGWVRICALAFPRQFRELLLMDLERLVHDRQRASGGARIVTGLNIVRAGLLARLDDVVRVARGGPRVVPPSPNDRTQGMESLLQDVGYALRTMRKSPGFTLVALLSLALGIGANTAIFTMVDAVLLRPLPVDRPDELAVLHWVAAEEGWPEISISGWALTNDDGRSESSSFSYRIYERLAAADGPFAAVTAFAPLYRVNVRVGDSTELESGQVVAGNYFNLLGVRPQHGRLLGPADDDPAAPRVAVISDGYFRRRFGGDPSALGGQLAVNGTPFEIVGVTPSGFGGALQVGTVPEVTVPLAHQAPVMRQRELLSRTDTWWLRVLGRLAPGATLDQATAFADRIVAASVEADLPGEENVPTARALPGGRGMTEQRSLLVPPLRTVGLVVGIVLLIACANLANLLLARSSARRREIAVRSSLGASRRRLVRQLLTESVVLSSLGAILGVALALAGRGFFLGVLGDAAELELGVRLDARALAFTGGIALLTGVVFGIAPALRASRQDLTPALKDEPDRRRRGEHQGLSRFILCGQVAGSLTLLVVAGHFVGTVRSLEAEATGFDGDDVVVFKIDPRLAGYTGAELVGFYDEVARRSRLVAGVRSVSPALHPPVSGTMTSSTVYIEGYVPAEDERMGTFLNLVDDAFFSTFQIEVVAGRVFQDSDTPETAPVAVVNEIFAARYFEGSTPIGRRLGFGGPENASAIEIVGVVRDVKYQNLRDDPWPAVHLLYRQHPDSVGALTIAMEVAGDPAAAMAAARDVVRAIDADVPVFQVASQRARQADNVREERQLVRLSLALGGVALLLSCIGLYGILSYGVQRRTREIGVRIALGARGSDIARLVMRELVTVAAGVAIGLGLAWGFTRSLQSTLYGVRPMEPAALAVATGLLLAVASVAAALPARRAARLDPVVALRAD